MMPKSSAFRLSVGLACLAAVVAGVAIWYPSTPVPAPSPNQRNDRSNSSDKPSSTVTICALRDHSFEVALKLLKESDFEIRSGITVKAVLLEFAPMVRAHELDFASVEGKYDLVSIDQPSLGHYVTSGWVRRLDQFAKDPSLPQLDADDIAPVLHQSCGRWNGGLYAVPLGSYGALFAYRTDILNAAGLEPPKTFAEFMSHALKVNAPPKLYGTALFAHEGEYITADAAPFLWSWGAGLINGCDVNLPARPVHRAAWDTPEGIAALEFYAKFYREGLAPPDTLQFDHARYIGAFQSGKIAMGIMPAEGIGAPMNDAEVSKVVGKIAYATLPGHKLPDGSINPPRAGLGAHSLAISKHSKHPRQAYLVLQFLTGKTIGPEYIRRGGRPFRNSHFSPEAIAAFPYMKAIKEGMLTGRCRPNIPEYPAVSKVFYTAFHSLLRHGGPVGEVMRAAAKKANDEILIPAYPDNTPVIQKGGSSE
ncbi:MAG: extracellular solute-binding protein [Phycisphaerales bacterium]|nr:extracellular solute-binding protein [Phycisphaerales bacterium]